MKKILSLLLVAIMLFSLGACAQEPAGTYPKTGNYRREDNIYPRLDLRENNEFKMVLTSTYENVLKGTYEVEDNILRLIEEDGMVYCFKVKKEILIFKADISDAIETPEGTLEDGEKFIFVR